MRINVVDFVPQRRVGHFGCAQSSASSCTLGGPSPSSRPGPGRRQPGAPGDRSSNSGRSAGALQRRRRRWPPPVRLTTPHTAARPPPRPTHRNPPGRLPVQARSAHGGRKHGPPPAGPGPGPACATPARPARRRRSAPPPPPQSGSGPAMPQRGDVRHAAEGAVGRAGAGGHRCPRRRRPTRFDHWSNDLTAEGGGGRAGVAHPLAATSGERRERCADPRPD